MEAIIILNVIVCDEWTPTVSAPSSSITPGQGMMGVNTDPSWHKATKRSHTPPLLKEVHLTRSHINFAFTSIEESAEKCGAPFDIPSKEAMWFVDEANSHISHTCFDHGGYNVHLVHDTW